MSGFQEQRTASNEWVVDQNPPTNFITGDNTSGVLGMVLETVHQTRGTANESHFLNELRSFLEKMTQGGHPEGTMPTYSAASPADSAAPDAKKANTPEKAKQEGANITQTGATFHGSVNASDINANQFATTGNQTNYAPAPKRGDKK